MSRTTGSVSVSLSHGRRFHAIVGLAIWETKEVVDGNFKPSIMFYRTALASIILKFPTLAPFLSAAGNIKSQGVRIHTTECPMTFKIPMQILLRFKLKIFRPTLMKSMGILK